MKQRNEIIPYEPHLKQLARELRKNSTLSEVLLWMKIKNKALGVEFHRQVPILSYIVDFYCHELLLAIEIDGKSHDDKEEQDRIRQEKMENQGVEFIRFQDIDIKKNMNAVLNELIYKIEEIKSR